MLTRAAATVLTVVCVVLGSTWAGATANATGAPEPFVFAHPTTNPALAGAGRVFEAAAGDASGQRVVMYGGQQPGNSTAYSDTWVNEPDGTWTPRCGTAVPGATAPCGPGPRDGLGMAGAPGGVVLFGGFAGDFGGGSGSTTLHGDTWQWDGSAWSQVCNDATCGPGARGLMAMAGNGASAVMFGGIGDAGLRSDTWVFNGSTWTQACGQPGSPCGPAALAGASMAWDGRHFVLFGGVDLNGSQVPVDDTWIFDGHRWTKVCGTSMGRPCGPERRALGAFAFVHSAAPDPDGAVLAEGGNLFGTGTQHLDRDAWFFDGSRWTQLDPPWNGPPVTFENNNSPPAGPDPLLGVLATKPALCEVVYLGTAIAATGPTPTMAEETFFAGRSLWARDVPSCRRSTEPTGPNLPARSVVPGIQPAPTPTAAPTAAAPTLAATGPGTARTHALLGLLLVALGALLVTAIHPRAAWLRN